jgi:hypothetical protein
MFVALYPNLIGVLSTILIDSLIGAVFVVDTYTDSTLPFLKRASLTHSALRSFFQCQRAKVQRAGKRWPQAKLELQLMPSQEWAKVAGVMLLQFAASYAFSILVPWLGIHSFATQYVHLPVLFIVTDGYLVLRFLAGDDEDERDPVEVPEQPRPVIMKAIPRPLARLRVQQVIQRHNQHSQVH